MAKKKKKNKSKATNPPRTKTGAQEATVVTGKTSKIGGILKNVVQKALPLAAKYAPGAIGTAAKIATGFFNHPWFWRQPSGKGFSPNETLGGMKYEGNDRLPANTYTPTRGLQIKPAGTPDAIVSPRVAILEMQGLNSVNIGGTSVSTILFPSEINVSSFLMPQIRRATNAVTMQSVESYQNAFASAASIYAFWRSLRALRFLSEHAPAVMPNLFDGTIPILQTENKPLLDALIRRAEETLHASVRLPHILCEYLAWRFGRIHRMNASARAGLVLYSVVPLKSQATDYLTFINRLETQLKAAGTAQANVDMFNAYHDHDLAVKIDDDTIMSYDAKEFVLRTNLDFVGTVFSTSILSANANPNPVIQDSDLPNPETFMASTVSTVAFPSTTGERQPIDGVLFPVAQAVFFAWPQAAASDNSIYAVMESTGGDGKTLEWAGDARWFVPNDQADWGTNVPLVAYTEQLGKLIAVLALCKQCDLYNAQVYVSNNNTAYAGDLAWGSIAWIDMTGISIDTGLVTEDTIYMEHKLAFQNLCSSSVKRAPDHREEALQDAEYVVEAAEQLTEK